MVGSALLLLWIIPSFVPAASFSLSLAPCANHHCHHHHHHHGKNAIAFGWKRDPSQASMSRARRRNSKPSDQEEDKSSGWSPQLVIPLWTLYVSNQWTRNSISGLVNFDTTGSGHSANAFTSMNVGLNFDESQYAILASIAFTSLFAVFSVLAGSIIDAADDSNLAAKRYSVVAAVAWSLAALGVAMADRYEAVAISRILMGLACAFTTPAAYSWINRVVADTKKSTATSIYGTGVALGSALSSITLILDERLGWRDTMRLIAAVGLSMAAISAWALPESSPSSKDHSFPASDGQSPPKLAPITGLATLYAGIQSSLASERAVWIYIASFFRFSAGLCIGVWSAPFFRMAFDNNVAIVDSYAISQGLISAVGASLSGILGGTIADRIVSMKNTTRNGKDGGDEDSIVMNTNSGNDRFADIQNRLWVPVVGSFLAAPAWYFALHTASSDTFTTSMTWLAVEYFVAECWFGPTISVLQATVTARGTAQGLFTLTGAAANLAPTALGIAVASDQDLQGTTILLDLLTNGVCIAYLMSSLCFIMAIRSSGPEENNGTASD